MGYRNGNDVMREGFCLCFTGWDGADFVLVGKISVQGWLY